MLAKQKSAFSSKHNFIASPRNGLTNTFFRSASAMDISSMYMIDTTIDGLFDKTDTLCAINSDIDIVTTDVVVPRPMQEMSKPDLPSFRVVMMFSFRRTTEVGM